MPRRKIKTRIQKLQELAFDAVNYHDPVALVQFRWMLATYPQLRIDVPLWAEDLCKDLMNA